MRINKVLCNVTKTTKCGVIERGWISLRTVTMGHERGDWVVDIVHTEPGREVGLALVKDTFHLMFEI
jgi:hypothetical protein